MAAISGRHSDYVHNKMLDCYWGGVSITAPAAIYLALFTTDADALSAKEVATTEALTGFSDFVVDATNNLKITSASHTFVAADTTVTITGGTGWTAGTYPINSVSAGAAILASSPAAVGATGGQGKVTRNTGYARIQLPFASFANAAANGQKANTAGFTLPSPTGNWGTVLSMATFDASTGGNQLAEWNANAPTTVNAGDAARTIAVGGIAPQFA